MALKDKIHYYKSLLVVSEGDIDKLNYIESGLNKLLEKNEDYRIYILLGKVELYKKELSLSKMNFLKAKVLRPNNSSIYNGLLKINIINQNYEEALENILKLKKIEPNYNFELYRYLLCNLLNKEDEYNIDDVFVNKKLNRDKLIIYLTAIKYLFENKHDESIEKFNELNELTKNNEYQMNFDYIIDLIGVLKNKYEFDRNISKIKDCIWNEDIESSKEIIHEIFQKSLIDSEKEKILHIIPKLVNIDEYVTANYINNNIKRIDRELKFSRMTSFYDRYINEMKDIYKLTGEEKESFQNMLRTGLDLYNKGEYVKALDYFSIGTRKTDIPLFYYYAGKTLFNLKKYKESRRAFNVYNEKGAYKIYLCKHYLSIIDFMFGKKGKAIQLCEDSEYFGRLLNIPFESNVKSVFEGNRNLNRMLETIDIKEEDFVKRI